MPVIRQAIIVANPALKDQDAFERKALTIRKQILNNIRALSAERRLPGLSDLYIASCSTRTLVYKGLLLAPQVESFYADFAQSADPVSTRAGAPALFEPTRFRREKLAPSVPLQSPITVEINTLRGNVNWMYARRRLDVVPT